MTGYVTRPVPRAWQNAEGEFWAERPSIIVHEDEPEPEFIGLLDQWDNELFRVAEKLHIGFDLTTRPKRRPKRAK